MFKIGDKVLVSHDTPSNSPAIGRIGTIVDVDLAGLYPYKVQFVGVPFPSTMNVERLVDGSVVRRFRKSELKLHKAKKRETTAVTEEIKIITKPEDRVVIALVKVENKTLKGVAKCHPNDKFDAHVGMMIAIAKAKGQTLPLFTGQEVKEVRTFGSISKGGATQGIEVDANNTTYEFPISMEV